MKTDDLLKASPHLVPWRPAIGIAPQPTDAEPVTLAMMQAMPGLTSEANLPKQPGYNKCLRKAAELLRRVTRLLPPLGRPALEVEAEVAPLSDTTTTPAGPSFAH
ncbi:hypothetical protein [Streptomyces sp. NPDC007905]|uniref:hypothetical protein n=1 Tax=Streptomyces sp. NPDC007905 TaxID=3364788 RepID=UPI0036EEA918